ncbi:hypothetical protein INT45_007871 [Circinella minor]|uniref:PH domain-containing protein n=1 Tax=Circinella minor TaxID=1195481 RepID=A0A8H7RTG4_9FUNG|nr:hypothetical protein INT45_007871 [Circinella minor]
MTTLMNRQQQQQQQTGQQKSLPHLPKSMVMTSKPLPQWHDENIANDMGTPSLEGRRQGRRQGQDNESSALTKHSSQHLQRAPSQALTNQYNTSDAPVFTAKPKTDLSLTKRRGSTIQKQVYRMDGGIQPTELLGTRLDAWRAAIKYLIKLFKEIQDIESKTAGGYSKSTKNIEYPIPEASGQFMESGGMQDVWLAFRNYAVEQSVRHQDYVNYLDRSVLPSLHSIKKDIKTILKAIHQDKNLKTTHLYEGRRRMDALVSKLDSVIQYNRQMPHTAYQRQDPLLINCAVYQANKQLFDSENALHENILNLQHEVHVFESNLVESIRSITLHLQQFRMERLEAHSAFGQVTSTLDNMTSETEWDEFVRRNSGNLISDDAPFRTDADISYPNQNNDLVQPIKVGLLERRSGLIRNWVEGLYVLTPSGFLHGYKSTQQFDADPMSPEVSIFIPHTNIDCSKNYDSMYQENAFEIKGKNAQSMMGMEKSFMLRAQDQNDLQDWFNKLVQISDQFRPEPLMQQQQGENYNQQQQIDGNYNQQQQQQQQLGENYNQQNEQNRALPPMPEEKELPNPSSNQQQQQQQQEEEEGEKVIQVPAEYVQTEEEINDDQTNQQESQDISNGTHHHHHHHQDKGKNPIPLSKNTSSEEGKGITSQQEKDLNDVVEEDDDWDTVPQEKGMNKK